MLKKILFRMAKSPAAEKIAGKIFQYFSWLLPVKKVYSTREVFAFCHPKPSYDHHVILTPKKAVRTLQQMATEDSCRLFAQIWEAIWMIYSKNTHYAKEFAIVANGGKRQEVQQVHFHMFTGHEMVTSSVDDELTEKPLFCNDKLKILSHSNPQWEFHFLIMPNSSAQTEEHENVRAGYFQQVLRSIDFLNARYGFVEMGYSLVFQYSNEMPQTKMPIFHIVSGKKIK